MIRHNSNGYYSGDPFFVVTCRTCGITYWSTRRVNLRCKKCNGEDVFTTPPTQADNEQEE